MSTERSGGKRVRSNAGKAAIAAGAFALGAGATAGATALIDGHSIKPGSIPLNRLTGSAQRELKGARGSRGAKGANGSAGAAGKNGGAGPAGATGATGTTGATGPFGPQLLSAAFTLGTTYVSPANGAVSATESDVQVPAPSAMTARSLAVALSSVPFVPVTVTLRDNGADTALTCEVDGTTTCSDSSDGVAVAAGDELSLKVTYTTMQKCDVVCSETAGISLGLS